MGSIRTHVRGNIVGYVALFFALSASAYAAGLAPNSVKSKHIKDGHVANADLAPDAVTASKVQNLSLTGGDLASNTVGGPQVAESTLGEVPRATIAGHGGYGRQSGGVSECDPTDSLYFTCDSVALTPSAPARMLVTGRFAVYGDENARVNCRLGSTTGAIPGSTVQVAPPSGLEWVTLVGVTDVYQPGNYSFGLDCAELGGDAKIRSALVTAVAISPF